MTQLTIEINDAKFIARATHQAAKEGRRDVTEWIKERMIRTARASLGMDADLSPGEAAQLLGVHINTVRNYIADGKFKHLYYRSPRCCRIPMRDIKALTKIKKPAVAA